MKEAISGKWWPKLNVTEMKVKDESSDGFTAQFVINNTGYVDVVNGTATLEISKKSFVTNFSVGQFNETVLNITVPGDWEGKHDITLTLDYTKIVVNGSASLSTVYEGTVKRKKKDPKDKPKDRIASPVDPDARHGHKTSENPFLGYKVRLTQNVNEIITNVEVDSGNFVDGDAQLPLCDELEDRQGKRPEKVSGDKAYGDGEVRHIQKEKGPE